MRTVDTRKQLISAVAAERDRDMFAGGLANVVRRDRGRVRERFIERPNNEREQVLNVRVDNVLVVLGAEPCAICRANGNSLYDSSSNPIDEVTSLPVMTCRIKPTIVLESTPPLKNAPRGTSDSRWSFTVPFSRSKSCSAACSSVIDSFTSYGRPSIGGGARRFGRT